MEGKRKFILSTGNIMAAGANVLRRPIVEKSNTELLSSLRENFEAVRAGSDDTSTWTTSDLADSELLYIPAQNEEEFKLQEEDRAEYDITVKLFYLPCTTPSERTEHTKSAVSSVLRALGTDKIDLIIASFPDITFDADDTPDLPTNPDQIAEWTSTWPELEALHDAGTIARLGIAEFGAQKLQALLDNTRVKPEVDQINVRDCCVVPKPLIVFTKERGLDLLTHNDCTEVLPEENLRELMTEFGLPSDGVRPRWVVKYTAVLKNRGVVENKGYIAMAEIAE